MTNSIDIKAKVPFPAGALSNFAPHAFTFDGVACGSSHALLATGGAHLTHALGSDDATETILTANEFCRVSSACAGDLKNSAQKRQGLVARNQSARSRHGSIFQ